MKIPLDILDLARVKEDGWTFIWISLTVILVNQSILKKI